MRKVWALLVTFVALVLCVPAMGQQAGQQAGQFFTGVNPRNIQATNLVHPGKGLKDYNFSTSMRKPAAPSVFNLNRVFPKISLGTWPPVVPTVGVLNQKSNPYQPNPPRGVNLFNPPPKK